MKANYYFTHACMVLNINVYWYCIIREILDLSCKCDIVNDFYLSLMVGERAWPVNQPADESPTPAIWISQWRQSNCSDAVLTYGILLAFCLTRAIFATSDREKSSLLMCDVPDTLYIQFVRTSSLYNYTIQQRSAFSRKKEVRDFCSFVWFIFDFRLNQRIICFLMWKKK
jgi:hypothetical protein